MKLSVFYDHIREAAGQNDRSLEEICTLVKSYGIDAVEMDAACYAPHFRHRTLWCSGSADVYEAICRMAAWAPN